MLKNIKISPSILSADFSKLGEEVRALCQAGADYIHVDVMDGHFVPNITIGPCVVEQIKKYSTVPLDVHLMISRPDKYIKDFINAGADILTLHVEADGFHVSLLKKIKSYGIKAGIALSPATSRCATSPVILANAGIQESIISPKGSMRLKQEEIGPLRGIVDSWIPAFARMTGGVDSCEGMDGAALIDQVLIMTVEPGFASQKFMHDQLKKIRAIKAIARPNLSIAVDGGINGDTASECVKAGANILVAGSYIFRNRNYKESIELLRRSW